MGYTESADLRRIVHISDLHFGRVNPALVAPLIAGVDAVRPDLIAVSGDLTQRATAGEFLAARDFLDRLAYPQVVVPGNHDISLWNFYRRFAHPLERFRRHISADVEPSYTDGELHVVGVNTARSLTWKEGRISERQVERLRAQLCALDPRLFKAVVMHHPFVPPEGTRRHTPVGRARAALGMLERCGADLVLAGHLHLGYARLTSSFYRAAGHSILVVQAGTTLSARTRGEQNSFNVIEVEPDVVEITVHVWDAARAAFAPRPPARYECRGEWRWVERQGHES